MVSAAEKALFESGTLQASLHIGYLHGTCDPFNLDATLSPLVNYTDARGIGAFIEDVDPVLGQMTIPVNGDYRFTADVLGSQTSAFKDERLQLWGRIANAPGIDGDYLLGGTDIATQLTMEHSIHASPIVALPQGGTVQLLMGVTGAKDFGAFTFVRVSFEVKFVALNA